MSDKDDGAANGGSPEDGAPSRAPKVPRPPQDARAVKGAAEARSEGEGLTRSDTRAGGDGPSALAADPTVRPRKLTLRGAPVCVLLIVSMSLIEAVLALQPGLRDAIVGEYAFRPIALLAVYFGAADVSELKTLITHQFLHGFPLHLMFNMLALAILGPPLERSAGSPGFLLLFLICGVGGGVGQFAWEYADFEYFGGSQAGLAIFLVGASGAVFGLLGADIAQRARALGRVDARFRRMSPAQFLLRSSFAVVLINVAIELLGVFVAGAAHLGGFVVGLLLGALLTPGGAVRSLPHGRP